MRSQAAIEGEILRQAAARLPDGSICPSEVARALWPDDWRARMAQVRSVGRALATAGRIVVTQRGEVRAPDVPIRGPIRYRLPR